MDINDEIDFTNLEYKVKDLQEENERLKSEIIQLKKQLSINNVMQSQTEKVCEGCKKPLETGLCGSCCSDLASGMY